MANKKIAVLGTGMAGFGANRRLKREPVEVVLYDKNSYYGGHTASHRIEPGLSLMRVRMCPLPRTSDSRASWPKT